MFIHKDKTINIVDRLSLAYSKNGDDEKFNSLINEALEDKIINYTDYNIFLMKHRSIKEKLLEIQKLNSEHSSDSILVIAKFSNCIPRALVTGFPSSDNIFDTVKAIAYFKDWFEEDKDKYPEFINLFYCLMAQDDREYTKQV